MKNKKGAVTSVFNFQRIQAFLLIGSKKGQCFQNKIKKQSVNF